MNIVSDCSFFLLGMSGVPGININERRIKRGLTVFIIFSTTLTGAYSFLREKN